MLNEILGDYPQIKVLDYLLTNPFAELSKLQLAVGSEISRITLNKFIDDMIDKQLIIKCSNSKYKLNIESPIIIKLNMILDELNKIAITEAMKYADEPYDELSDEELDMICDENAPDVDLYKLEKEIMNTENYNILIEDNKEKYLLTIER